MAYIAKVPVTFGGRKFYKGDRIPEDLVMSPKRQEELGTITVIPEPEVPVLETEAPVLETEALVPETEAPVLEAVKEPESFVKEPEAPKKAGRKAKSGGSAGDA